MPKGAPLSIPSDAGIREAAEAVFNAHREDILSSKGWFGTAVVNRPAPEGDEDAEATQFLVKRVNGGFKVFTFELFVPLNIEASVG